MKIQKEIHHAIKEAGVAILIADKYFRVKITRKVEGHFTTIRGSIIQKDIFIYCHIFVHLIRECIPHELFRKIKE